MGDLLSAHTASQFAAWGLCMRGKVIARQRCPVCGQAGRYAVRDFGPGRQALVCQCGQHISDRPEIELIHKRKRLRITHGQDGQRFRLYEHAARALGVIRDQIERGAFYAESWQGTRASGLVWENYVSAWLERQRIKMPEGTYNTTEDRCKHLAWFNGLNVRELRNGHLEDFAVHLSQGRLKPSTQGAVIVTLRAILNGAYRRGDIEKPLTVPLPALPHHPRKHLTAEQQALVLKHILEEDQPIFLFLMQFGCRVGEACALCWDMVDQARSQFLIARTHSACRWLDSTKTRKDRPMPIMGWFEGWLSRQEPAVGRVPVFINPDAWTKERNYNNTCLARLWKQALRAAGLEHVPLKNGTRHSLGFALRHAGADMDGIARVLGHSNPKTTRVYVEDDLAATAELLGNVNRARVIRLADQRMTKPKN
ncbi:MAG: tyrosine-type recombinase/integrase [Desulfarculus sp.]|nr:tyrosine-type recombinase/integrase [Desulfarculus sp.]